MPKLTSMLFSLVLIWIGMFSPVAAQSGPGIQLHFDDSAARYVLENPTRAIALERDSIWSRFEGYRITLAWHKASSYPVTWDLWERGLNKFIEDTSLISRTLELTDSLHSKAQREQTAIARHLSSYLGSDVTIEASVYLVAFTIPYAFCVERNKIGIDVTGHEWNFNTDCILNTVIHEIYHVGHRALTPDLKYLEADPVNEETYVRFCYAYLQSEGMATYVAYRALDLYPSEYRHEDYDLIENEARVKTAIRQISGMVEDAGTVPIDSMNQKAWDIGVEERAFYIAGAYMARVIEEEYGTDHLAALVRKGGLEFAREYDAVVADEYKIPVVDF